MPLRSRLPLLPPDAQELTSDLAISEADGRILFHNAAGPIYSCPKDDRLAVRVGAVMVQQLRLAGPAALGQALGLHRATLFRDRRKYEQGGVEALRERTKGPRRPHKLTPRKQREAQRLLDEGHSIRATAAAIGMTDGGVRGAMLRGLLTPPSAAPAAVEVAQEEEALLRPGARAAEDQSSEGGVAVKRTLDRVLACFGHLQEANVSFVAAEAVAGAGALLALPALLEQGLVDIGTKVYGQLSNGFFGLRSVLLTLAYMALLRIKTVEQLTEHAPGELGLLLGLDRAPEVKTLRRKLDEMGKRGHAWTFMRAFTERWAKAERRELALLYIDGHVRPYHGRKHVLPKHHVQQRGRPMPGTKDFHVSDRRAMPLLFVTAEATEGLLKTLDSSLLPKVRQLVRKTRRVTIVFDREGWSPQLFAKWKSQGFDVLTYRKGKQSQWRERFFEEVSGKVGGEKVAYRLAERKVRLSNGLKVREVRRLTEDGHQTAVITTNEKLPVLAVAHRMFSRWRQENFFRYMRQEFALDHLCTRAVEPADPKRLVPHPERKKLGRRLSSARSALWRLVDRRAKLEPGKTARVGKHRVDEDRFDMLIQKAEVEVERLASRVAELPKHVPLEDVLDSGAIVQLERERKVIVDAIKLTAYRAESALARLVEPLFRRHEDEARKFLKTIFQATADIIPDEQAGTITVRFHGLASPRATRALQELCALVNEDAAVYPATQLRLWFEAP